MLRRLIGSIRRAWIPACDGMTGEAHKDGRAA